MVRSSSDQSESLRVTIEKLRATFATHSIPTTLVSDNGSNFCSEEFEDFLTKNGIHNRKTAPYHPSSNGLTESAVQTFKDGMKKMSEKGSLETRVSRFLFKYRITPHSTTRGLASRNAHGPQTPITPRFITRRH